MTCSEAQRTGALSSSVIDNETMAVTCSELSIKTGALSSSVIDNGTMVKNPRRMGGNGQHCDHGRPRELLDPCFHPMRPIREVYIKTHLMAEVVFSYSLNGNIMISLFIQERS